MQFDLMGPLEIRRDGHTVSPTAPKPRQVLALLALNAGTVVPADQIVDELWPDGPPSSAKTTVQTYVHQLRKLLGPTVLVTRPAGYLLAVPPEAVDVFRFERLAREGREALRDGDATRAAGLLRDALALWRGPVLGDIVCGPRLLGHAAYLEEHRIEALSLRIEADLAGRRHWEIVGELRWLVTRHRLHEWLYVRLMQALHHCGRRADALDVYQELRGLLDEELGMEPSHEAKQLHLQILAA
jgi:DNA-binding SARP family transcriptional activator